jgi:hypothetical protein
VSLPLLVDGSGLLPIRDENASVGVASSALAPGAVRNDALDVRTEGSVLTLNTGGPFGDGLTRSDISKRRASATDRQNQFFSITCVEGAAGRREAETLCFLPVGNICRHAHRRAGSVIARRRSWL